MQWLTSNDGWHYMDNLSVVFLALSPSSMQSRVADAVWTCNWEVVWASWLLLPTSQGRLFTIGVAGGERCSQLSEFLTKWLLNQGGPWCPPSFMTAGEEPLRCQSGNRVHIYNWISYISHVRSQLVFKTELKNLSNYLKKIVRTFQWQIVRLWTHLYAKSYYSWIFSLNF